MYWFWQVKIGSSYLCLAANACSALRGDLKIKTTCECRINYFTLNNRCWKYKPCTNLGFVASIFSKFSLVSAAALVLRWMLDHCFGGYNQEFFRKQCPAANPENAGALLQHDAEPNSQKVLSRTRFTATAIMWNHEVCRDWVQCERDYATSSDSNSGIALFSLAIRSSISRHGLGRMCASGAKSRFYVVCVSCGTGQPGFTPLEQQQFSNMLAVGGLCDAFRHLHPERELDTDKPAWTWRGTPPGKVFLVQVGECFILHFTVHVFCLLVRSKDLQPAPRCLSCCVWVRVLELLTGTTSYLVKVQLVAVRVEWTVPEMRQAHSTIIQWQSSSIVGIDGRTKQQFLLLRNGATKPTIAQGWITKIITLVKMNNPNLH